ncbi:L,D-transpeptidase family protein [Haloimpatiens sp. FM7330]|uniref:L,D-transpeptidase family protein n=1 Tax=Haloimpatiens sp. FM7330 TaxID=3298610 RepID=UPI0036264687
MKNYKIHPIKFLRSILILIFIIIFFLIALHNKILIKSAKSKELKNIANSKTTNTFSNTTKNINSFEYISSLIKSSPVICTTVASSTIYSNHSLYNSEEIDQVKSDSKLEILEDYYTKWYKVKKLSNGKIGWIKDSFISIPPDPNTNKNRLSKNQLETYVNNKNFDSTTDQFIWVDLDRQLTYIFSGHKNNWSLTKTISIASGLNESPTTRGVFKIKKRGTWFYSEEFQAGAKYWVEFNDSYLFHSVSMDKYQNIKDPVVGERRSSGCVRMPLEDIKWFYDTIKTGTTVYVN